MVGTSRGAGKVGDRMPCWVAPAVAAELWGVSVAQVMADVDAGRVGACTEQDVLFVDVASALDGYPAAAAPARQSPRPACRRSLAWTVAGAQTIVTPAERDALLTFDDDAAGPDAATAVERATKWECRDASHAGDGEHHHDVPESVHDEGEPAPLPDGPETMVAPAPVAAEEPPQWEAVRSRVSRMRRPPLRVSEGVEELE